MRFFKQHTDIYIYTVDFSLYFFYLQVIGEWSFYLFLLFLCDCLDVPIRIFSFSCFQDISGYRMDPKLLSLYVIFRYLNIRITVVVVVTVLIIVHAKLTDMFVTWKFLLMDSVLRLHLVVKIFNVIIVWFVTMSSLSAYATNLRILTSATKKHFNSYGDMDFSKICFTFLYRTTLLSYCYIVLRNFPYSSMLFSVSVMTTTTWM